MNPGRSLYGNPEGQVLRPRDLLLASGLLASGSFLLLLSSLGLMMYSRDLRLLALAYPAIFLHFLGWGALAGLLTEPEGGRTEDPIRLRRKALIFSGNLIAFVVGVVLLILVYPEATQSMPAWVFMFGAFLFPFVPVVYAPVVFVHAGLFWWSSGALRALGQRRLVQVASLVLVAVVGFGLYAQLANPERVLELAPLAGLMMVGYVLAAIGWGLAFRQEMKLTTTLT